MARSAKGRGIGLAQQSNTPKKASLKPLHWVKVTRAVQGSLWADAQKQGNQARYLTQIYYSMISKIHSFSLIVLIESIVLCAIFIAKSLSLIVVLGCILFYNL
jgi:hypothetical protein